jgi:glycosyltransferase involved in cell wall biosynthesis
MKVGIDTFGCDHGRSGLGSYLFSLASHLKGVESAEFSLFGTELDRYTYSSDNTIGYTSVALPENVLLQRAWHFFVADKFASSQNYDVVLYPAAARMLPVFFRTPGVASVNDIVSDFLTERQNRWCRCQVIAGLKHADRIIAASQYIRKDLERLGIPGERIAVVHNGIDHSAFYPRVLLSPDLVDIKPFAIQRPYFIYASRMSSPTKKHVELIKAFSLFKEKTKYPHRLVLAGSGGSYEEAVHKAALRSRSASDIFITGFFPHENFPELYSGSEGCIFPSVSEGVGLPVLESMATGVPVACAKSGALPEIAGNNALFFDADNIEEMAAVMQQLVENNEMRTRLITGGIEWTKRFCWSKTAEMTVSILREAAKK